MEPDMVTVTEAARILGASKEKIARLVKSGVLTARRSRIDARRRLIPRAQIERILVEEGRTLPVVPDRSVDEADAALWPRTAGIYKGPVSVHGRDVDEYLREHWKPEE